MRTARRLASSVAFAAATGVLAALTAGSSLAWPESTHASTLQVRQLVPPAASPAPAGGATAPAASPAPAPASSSNVWSIADTGGIPARVRSAPSLTATVVMRLEPGTVVEPLTETASADGYQWRKISVSGSSGWIVTTLLMEPPPPPRIPVYSVAAVGERGLNVRESPSTAAPVIGSLREGVVVELVSGPREAESRQWLQVRTDKVAGWVIAEAISER
jgi:SH3-like domain-containing protein